MNKASGGDGIPVELFQIVKDDTGIFAQYASKSGKLSSGHRTGKGQFSFQSQRQAMVKTKQKQKILRGGKNTQKNYKKRSS